MKKYLKHEKIKNSYRRNNVHDGLVKKAQLQDNEDNKGLLSQFKEIRNGQGFCRSYRSFRGLCSGSN